MMKYQKGFTLVELVLVMVVIFVLVGWVKNLIKLSECDSEAPYKAEVIHVVGIVPIVGAFTGWMDVGK